MNEPFLQAFRVPNLVGEMISEHMPLVVAVRATMQENYGQPWRLVFFGDPLYRLKTSVEIKAPRLASWLLTASWPAYTEPSRPTNGTDADLFLWSFKTALARLQGKPAKGTGGEDLIEALLSIKRSKLPADFRPIDDALSIDILLEARRRGALESRLMAIPPAERTPEVKRCIETMKAIDFNLAIVRGDATAIRAAWREVMKLEGADELKKLSTHRVGDAADTPVRRHDWLNLLRASLRDRAKSPDAEFLTAEIRRMEEYLKGDR
jgi:hypothetical protein